MNLLTLADGEALDFLSPIFGLVIIAAVVLWLATCVKQGNFAIFRKLEKPVLPPAPHKTPRSAFPFIPPAIPIPPGPGRFKITGVDRDTKMDCIQYYEALGPDNAKVKAELDGIIVTRIEAVS